MLLVNCKGWSVRICLPPPSFIPSSFISSIILLPQDSVDCGQYCMRHFICLPHPSLLLFLILPFTTPPSFIPPSPPSSFCPLFLILPFPLFSLSSSSPHTPNLYPPPTESNHLSPGVQHGESFPAGRPLQSLRECHHHPGHRAGHASLVLLFPLELQTVRTEKLMASHQLLHD